MRLRTEIIQSNFIVTCDGAHLDTYLAQTYLTAMGAFIRQSKMDIFLDLSTVDGLVKS